MKIWGNPRKKILTDFSINTNENPFPPCFVCLKAPSEVINRSECIQNLKRGNASEMSFVIPHHSDKIMIERFSIEYRK